MILDYIKLWTVYRLSYFSSFLVRLTRVGAIRSLVIDLLFRPYLGWRTLHVIGKTNFGLRMYLELPDSIQTSIFLTGEWEPAVSKIIANSLSSGDTFIDVGANIGWHTLLASNIVGQTGKVYSIEASPSIYRKLKNNIELNGIRNSILINVAVSNKPGSVSIWTAPEGNLGHSTIVEEIAILDGHHLEAEIPCDLLSSLISLPDLLSARMIKIDIEGAERLAIEGVLPLLNQFTEKTEWLVELSPGFTSNGSIDADWIFRRFVDSGYSAYQIKNEYGPLARRHEMEPQMLRKISDCPVEKLCDLLFSKSIY